MRDLTPATDRQIEAQPIRITWAHILRLALAFILAIGLWAWVTQITDPVTDRSFREIDIMTGQLPDTLTVVTALPRVVVAAHGPRSSVDELARTDLTVTLDTSSVTGAGEYQLPLLVTAPDGSADFSVQPASVQVEVDDVMSRVMALEVQKVTLEGDRRIIGDTVPDPSQVTVTGPSTAVERVDRVMVQVALDAQTQSYSKLFSPFAIDANGQRVTEVQILPAQVSVNVELLSQGKTINVIPIVNGLPAEGFSVQARAVEPSTVVVDGPENALDGLLFVNTKPIDISGASEAVSQTVGLEGLPDGVKVIDPANGQVQVRVALQDDRFSTQTLEGVPVQVLNQPAGMTAELDRDMVSLTVSGPSETIAAMENAQVQVIVNLANLAPGEHTITPQVLLPAGLTWISSDPAEINVTLTRDDLPIPNGTPSPATRQEAAPVVRRRSYRVQDGPARN